MVMSAQMFWKAYRMVWWRNFSNSLRKKWLLSSMTHPKILKISTTRSSYWSESGRNAEITIKRQVKFSSSQAEQPTALESSIMSLFRTADQASVDKSHWSSFSAISPHLVISLSYDIDLDLSKSNVFCNFGIKSEYHIPLWSHETCVCHARSQAINL